MLNGRSVQYVLCKVRHHDAAIGEGGVSPRSLVLSFAPMKLLLRRRRGESLDHFHLSSGERLRWSMITVAWKVTPGDFWSIRGVHTTFDQGKRGGYF